MTKRPIGRPIVMTLLQNNTQQNHAEIGVHVTAFNRLFQNGMASQVWNPLTASGRAALDGVITQQAMAIAYLDDFKFMMLISLVVMPLVLLFRRPARSTAPSPAHAAVME